MQSDLLLALYRVFEQDQVKELGLDVDQTLSYLNYFQENAEAEILNELLALLSIQSVQQMSTNPQIFYELSIYFKNDENNTVIRVLKDPSPENIQALIDLATAIDSQWRNEHGSLKAFFNELIMTCASVVVLLLKSLAAIVVLPAAFLSIQFHIYIQSMENSVKEIEKNVYALETVWNDLTYNYSTKITAEFLRFFPVQPEPVNTEKADYTNSVTKKT